MDFGNFNRLVVLITVSLIYSGCASFHATPPKEFAPYKGKNTYRAVSPEGVNFRVRTEENKPFAELSFWKEAMQNRMIDAGYTFVDSSNININEKAGFMLELAAPLGPEDYSYLISIVLKGKEIIIIEAAGEVNKFQKRKPDIIEAIKKIEL